MPYQQFQPDIHLLLNINIMNTKIAFKSDGTAETGAKIINTLKGLGGNNPENFDGCARDAYYFITWDNKINWQYEIPNGYDLNIDEPEPTFPRQMWCWDSTEVDGQEDEVLAIFPNRISQYKVIGTNTSWKNAIELPTQKPNPDSNEIINKMQETIDDLLTQIKELKTITNK